MPSVKRVTVEGSRRVPVGWQRPAHGCVPAAILAVQAEFCKVSTGNTELRAQGTTISFPNTARESTITQK